MSSINYQGFIPNNNDIILAENVHIAMDTYDENDKNNNVKYIYHLLWNNGRYRIYNDLTAAQKKCQKMALKIFKLIKQKKEQAEKNWSEPIQALKIHAPVPFHIVLYFDNFNKVKDIERQFFYGVSRGEVETI